MIRTQIQLSEEQARALRELAARDGRSMADLVRESVDLLLRRRRIHSPSRELLVERALAAVGHFRSESGDLGRRHDDYFADSVAEWPSSSTPPR
jgi:Arc/MetJ-type ribon-helix-helix transcriptional regulator